MVPIATGDLFRIHLNNNTELGITAKNYMNKGNLVPDNIVINMVEDKIDQSQNVKGFILCFLLKYFYKNITRIN